MSYTEIKNGKRIVTKKITIEKDLDAVLKEFNFKALTKKGAVCEWELSDFTIHFAFDDEKNPHIFLFCGTESIVYYQTYSHRMWWHGKYPSGDGRYSSGNGDMIELHQDESVINDLMDKLRTKWNEVKNAH